MLSVNTNLERHSQTIDHQQPEMVRGVPVITGKLMNPDEAYNFFTNYLTPKENLIIKEGKGGLSYYKSGVFVCHFNAKPQSKRDDIGFADFRFDALRPYLDIETTISEIHKEAAPDVEIKSHKLWCSLHFPLLKLEHIADLFLKHIITKVNISSN